MAALSHSTRRTLFVAGRIPARSSYPQHESDVTYTPLRDRVWDVDSETFQPKRRSDTMQNNDWAWANAAAQAMHKTDAEQSFDEDAGALCDEAMRRAEHDVVRALAWINYEWRSSPDSRESDLMDRVTDMLRQYASDIEWQTWKAYCEGTGAMLYGTAIKAKYTRAAA